MKLNVFVVGPLKSGKTSLSNYLADLQDSLNYQDYHPTQGKTRFCVRILECDRKITLEVKKSKKEANVSAEIWDCSGDDQYLPNWSALSSDCHALIYVCSPDSKSEKEIEQWQSIFPNLKPNQCVIFAHQPSGGIPQRKPTKFKIQNKSWSKVHVVHTSLDHDQEVIKTEFDRLLANAILALQEARDKEEQSIMNAQQQH